ncbi:MAG: PadR family transcriptional regulator [Methanobacterium sp. ERen5]|nr:MAG: PadR family transcriptional regulator [Methanobacterium sp. ERen5]
MFVNHRDIRERMEELEKIGGLRVWILSVLSEGPKNGVEIADDIHLKHQKLHEVNFMDMNKRFEKMHNIKFPDNQTLEEHLSWRPSNGSLYPMLKKMVSEDLIVKNVDGKYSLSKQGTETTYKLFGNLLKESYVDHNKITIKKTITELNGYISILEDFRPKKLSEHREEIISLHERFEEIYNSVK